MPPVQLNFPITALPGRRPGEGQGDLINTFARKVGSMIRWQRVPGAKRFTPPMFGDENFPNGFVPRGQLPVDQYLISVWGDKVTRTLSTGGMTVLTGDLPGTSPVTLARNLRTPPEVVAVADNVAYSIDIAASTVTPYPFSTEPGVPAETSIDPVTTVDYFSGYFVFSRPYRGEFLASELQSMQWKTLSFARAEGNPDGLLRMFSSQPVLLACGTETIELYQDVGASPFPLQRVTIIPVGLIGPWAIAGGASEWDRPLCWVANDATVRQLKGYDPIIISNEDISFDIQDVARAGLSHKLIAQVYTHGDNAVWSLSAPTWTWEHNLSTGSWHRRRSYQPDAPTAEAVPWRASSATRFDHRWIAQDNIDGGLIEITHEALSEPAITRDRPSGNPPVMMPVQLQAPLIARCESGPTKEVPANIRMSGIFLDFTVGFNVPGVPDPAVFLSWSHDGGATWSNPLERRIGGKGEYRTLVTLRSTGRSSHQGMRLRWECIDPVPVSFHSAVSPRTTASRPRQVDVVHPPHSPPFGKVPPGGASG